MTSSSPVVGPSDHNGAHAVHSRAAAAISGVSDMGADRSSGSDVLGRLFAAAFTAFLLVWALFGQRAGDIAFAVVMFGFPALVAAVAVLSRANRDSDALRPGPMQTVPP